MAIARRDDTMLCTRLAQWAEVSFPDRAGRPVVTLRRPKEGFTNETLLVDLAWAGGTEEWVVRIPPVLATFPVEEADTVGTEGSVLEMLWGRDFPTPRLIALVREESWLGAPFLVMDRVGGRPVGPAPSLDSWLTGLSLARQRSVQVQFLESLVSLHQIDWRADQAVQGLRGVDGDLRAEVEWWDRYVHWAADGEPVPALVRQIEWCRAHCPGSEPPAALCWGDARLGNVMYDDDGQLCALIDWELASVGPPEMDLAWYLALEEVTAHFVARTVPGFLGPTQVIPFYESRLGRPLADMAWHQIFALVRSIAINERQARQAASAGVRYPGVAGPDNPLLEWVDLKIAG